LQFENANAGVCCFVGTGSDVIEALAIAMQSPTLKKGGNIQETFAEVIRWSGSKSDCCEKSILPQMISTLPLLVDFPEETPCRIEKSKLRHLHKTLGLIIN